MSERRHYGPLEVRIIDQAHGANLDLGMALIHILSPVDPGDE